MGSLKSTIVKILSRSTNNDSEIIQIDWDVMSLKPQTNGSNQISVIELDST